MSLYILLIIYITLLLAFLALNGFVIYLVYKFRFVGPWVQFAIPIYIFGILIIILITYGAIGNIEWAQRIFLSSFKFW